MKKISIYKNVYDNSGTTSDLRDMIFADKYKYRVQAIRKIEDADSFREAKKLMPMYTPSGIFSKRSKDGLIQHSGYICLDVDGKDNPDIDLQAFLGTLRDAESIYFASRSISGSGVFILVPVAFPDKHELHFDALVEDFSKMGIKIDKSGRDVSRARFVSYDPDPIYNPDAKVYNRLLLPKKQEVEFTSTDTNIEILVKKTIDSGINITASYHDWFALACSLRHVPRGREMFHALSAMDSRYDETQSNKQFDAVLHGHGYNESKFFEICRRYGITLKDC